jgi:D-beta-D-heptose 7-phosphate kinase/D-beta-D-heptose 1-phosphate adenosyltransferase
MIVFTNGAFDQIHIGHIRLLRFAYRLDSNVKLVIGLNSDESVRRLKGPDRPKYSQYHRMEVLTSIRYVDGVIIFEDDTPIKLIENVKPDIIVKGADWEAGNVVGRHLAKVVICPADLCFPHKDVNEAIKDNVNRGLYV